MTGKLTGDRVPIGGGRSEGQLGILDVDDELIEFTGGTAEARYRTED